MLHEFLIEERENILELCAKKNLHLSDLKATSDEMEKGLPIFYNELIEVLRLDSNEVNEISEEANRDFHVVSAVRRGKESLKLGYSISQVVYGYGALCQSITQYLEEKNSYKPTAREFNRLNLCLDIAIAEAVTEFDRVQSENVEREEVQRLGFLAHELRNALFHATIAYQMIKTGKVGASGNTAQILEEAHIRMKNIIDRSLAEVRLRNEPIAQRQRCKVINLVSEVEVTSAFEASAKSVKLHVEGASGLQIFVDRHLIISALSNLVQNAIKFTTPGGNIWIRCKAVDNRVLIEIEDQCGGLPPGKTEELLQPFSQKGTNKTGLGLGLTIAQRCILLNDGILTVRDLPHQGCVFTINLPLIPDTYAGE